jgi:hypothetical protein
MRLNYARANVAFPFLENGNWRNPRKGIADAEMGSPSHFTSNCIMKMTETPQPWPQWQISILRARKQIFPGIYILVEKFECMV